MSTKLNAEELADERFPQYTSVLATRRMAIEVYAEAIREVVQPIADERDEMWRALTYMVRIAEDQGWTDDFLSIPRAILAKYPKP